MSNNNIEEILNNLGAEQVPEDIKKIAHQTSNNFTRSLKQQQPKQYILLKFIMKSTITKFATAAVIIIGIILVFNYLGGSIDGTSNALAGVIQTMKTKPWVHSIMSEIESGKKIQESWSDIESQTFACKQYWNKELTFISELEKTEYTYKEEEGVIYYSQIDYSFVDDDIVMNSAFELVDSIVDFINKEALDVTSDIITQDGKEVEVIKITPKTNDKSIYEKIECTMDMEENLLLSSRMYYKDIPEYILALEQKEHQEELIKSRTDLLIRYDYPATGPGSIYDLGAPRDADIIVSTLPTNVQETIDKLSSLRETTLTKYIAIAISGDSDTMPTSPEGLRSAAFFSTNDRSIYSIWRKDNFFRFTQGYFPVLENMPSRNEIAENVESWFQEIAPVREFILLPEGKYNSHQYHWENVGSIVRAETVQLRTVFYQSDESLIENCWPKINVPRKMAMQWSLEHIDDITGEKLVMITRKIDIGTEKWYINPDKNYICQKHEAYGSDGTLVYRKEILEYATTESGLFYPRKIQMTKNIQQDNKLEKDVATKFIYLKENPDYPNWIFNPNSFPESDQ